MRLVRRIRLTALAPMLVPENLTLTDRQIRRGSHRSVLELEKAIREFIDANNAEPKPFVWLKSADQILASIARFAQRTLDASQAT